MLVIEIAEFDSLKHRKQKQNKELVEKQIELMALQIRELAIELFISRGCKKENFFPIQKDGHGIRIFVDEKGYLQIELHEQVEMSE